MLKSFSLLSACVGVLLFSFSNNTVASPAAQKPVGEPLAHTASKMVIPIEHWRTGQGSRVYFVREDQLPFVDIRVIFYAGSTFDGKKPGLAQFTNNLMPEGTKHLSANQIAKLFDSVGSEFSQSTSRDIASFSLRTLTAPEALNQSINTLAKIITQPGFPENAFSRLKKQTLNAIKATADDPGTVANNAFYKALYGEHGYGHPVLGLRDAVAGFTQDDVRHFYNTYYQTNNAMLVVVGDLTKEKAHAIAKQLLATLPAGKQHHVLAAHAQTKAATIRIKFPATQDNIRIGNIAVSRKHPDYFPLMVGNAVLGGNPLSSLLGKKIREEYGLTYGISSQFSGLLAPGPFVVNFSSRADQAKRAIDLTRKLVATFVKQGPSKEQLTFTKQYLTNSFPIKLDNNARILVNVAQIAIYQLPINYLDTYLSRVSAVTAKHIKQAFKRHVHPNNLSTVIVGPMPTSETTVK